MRKCARNETSCRCSGSENQRTSSGFCDGRSDLRSKTGVDTDRGDANQSADAAIPDHLFLGVVLGCLARPAGQDRIPPIRARRCPALGGLRVAGGRRTLGLVACLGSERDGEDTLEWRQRRRVPVGRALRIRALNELHHALRLRLVISAGDACSSGGPGLACRDPEGMPAGHLTG